MVIHNPLVDEHRAHILGTLLENKKITISELAKKLNLSATSIRHHIDVLKDANIISLEISGRKTYIKLREDKLAINAAKVLIQLYERKFYQK